MSRSLLFLSLIVAACGIEPTEDRSTDTSGKLSSNGLVLHGLALGQLSADPLGGDAAAALATTEEGRELLEYVALCALPAGSTLRVGEHAFDGELGLAPAWEREACAADCQRWITACLLAHANKTAVSVPIWLRADHAAIGDGDGAARFSYQEAAFFGDVFVERGEVPEMHACVGRGVAERLPAEENVTLIEESIEEFFKNRLCSVGEECGLAPAGMCASYFDGVPAACDRDAGAAGAFGGCHGGFASRDGVPGGPAFAEVITVYLEP